MAYCVRLCVALLLMVLIAPDASATVVGKKSTLSARAYNFYNSLFSPINKLLPKNCQIKGGCTVYFVVDPPAAGVTSAAMSLQYDASFMTFNQSLSGPLGAFSIGGDAPPPDPGIGTQPIAELPATGFSPGLPLAGSTLNYSGTAGLLTVDYHLASPVTVPADVNFFLLAFDFVTSAPLDAANSTATYSASGPGADWTQLAFTCTTSDLLNVCGSDTPATGVTFNFALVPEPPIWMVPFAMLAVLGFVRGGLTQAASSRISEITRSSCRNVLQTVATLQNGA